MIPREARAQRRATWHRHQQPCLAQPSSTGDIAKLSVYFHKSLVLREDHPGTWLGRSAARISYSFVFATRCSCSCAGNKGGNGVRMGTRVQQRPREHTTAVSTAEVEVQPYDGLDEWAVKRDRRLRECRCECAHSGRRRRPAKPERCGRTTTSVRSDSASANVNDSAREDNRA